MFNLSSNARYRDTPLNVQCGQEWGRGAGLPGVVMNLHQILWRRCRDRFIASVVYMTNRGVGRADAMNRSLRVSQASSSDSYTG